MLVIRFFRTGKKNQPHFKIVVTEKTRPTRAGRFTEEVGFYNPLTKEKSLNGERIKYWISVGAKPSATVHNMLVSEKIIKDSKIPKHKNVKNESRKAGRNEEENAVLFATPESAEKKTEEKPAAEK